MITLNASTLFDNSPKLICAPMLAIRPVLRILIQNISKSELGDACNPLLYGLIYGSCSSKVFFL